MLTKCGTLLQVSPRGVNAILAFSGFLLPPEEEVWASEMSVLAKDAELAKKMGESGRKRVQEKFSFEQFRNTLDRAVRDVLASR